VEKKPFYSSMMFQLVAAMVLGALAGWQIQAHHASGLADTAKLFPTLFIHLIKMVVGIIIFCTLSTAIANMGDGKDMGKIAWQSILFFEVVSTLALLFGQAIGNIFQPGLGAHYSGPPPVKHDCLSTLQTHFPESAAHALCGVVSPPVSHSPIDFILDIVPQTIVSALTQNNLLQVLLISILFGFALLSLREAAKPLIELIESLTEVVFSIVGMIMKMAPLAVFGAIAFTVGQFGFDAFAPLGKLVGMLYLGCAVFVVLVFGGVAWYSGFSLWKFMAYIKDEIILVYATASSEAALPRLIAKLEKAGCAPSAVGFIVPAGYSFNLVGSSLYLTLAVLFISQATHHPLPPATQWALLGFFLLTSKGMAGVTAGSFALLTTALTTFDISDSWLPLIFAVDRIMDAMRSITNLVGNGVSALVIAKWAGERNDRQMNDALNGTVSDDAVSSHVIRGEDSAETEVPAFLG
jgi:aerobic C4-dicarboxylate transport protein